MAYDENDTIIAEDIKTSFGDGEVIQLIPDKTELNANGRDLLFVEITVVDKENIPVENANNRVNITVTGPGVLVGVDNGDSTDYDQYKGYSKRLFSGKLLAVISSTFKSGEITILAESSGLKSSFITINALPSVIETGSCEPLP